MNQQESSIDKARAYLADAEQFMGLGDTSADVVRNYAEMSRAYSALGTAEIVFDHVALVAEQLEALATLHEPPSNEAEQARAATFREAAGIVRAALK